MAIGLVIVNFHSSEDTLGAVKSARAAAPEIFRPLIVENGSGEAERIRTAGLECLELPENHGFAAGVNAGVGKLFGDDPDMTAVLLLNPDARLERGEWRRWLSVPHENLAAKGPAMVSPEGDIVASCYGEFRPWRALLEASGLHELLLKKGIRRHPPVGPTDVVAVQGSCLLILRRAWEMAGPFDERFFLYHEEYDWCLRARKAGLRILYDPGVRCVHEKGTAVPEGREALYYRGLAHLAEKHLSSSASARFRKLLRGTLQARCRMEKRAERAACWGAAASAI